VSVLSRRSFLRSGSVTMVAAGVMAAVPGLSSLLAASPADTAAVDGAVTDAVEAPSLDSALVAHVRDLQTGEIAVYHGTQEFIFHDPAMAARLFYATR